jgi:hypothetical protein
VTLHAPADPAGADATRSCRALDRVEPAVWHPPSPAFSSADGPNVTAFDAPVATRVRRSAHTPPGPPSPRPRQRAVGPTTQDAFHRQVPSSTAPLARVGLGRWTRHRSRDFAAPVRLPALLRPPLPKEEGLDPVASGTLFTPGRTRPRAARRLLQSKTIRKHDRRTSETPPSSRAARLSPCSPSRVGSRSGNWTSAFAAVVPPIGSRGFTGQGPFDECAGFRRAHSSSSRHDCACRELRPNPIGTRTPLVAPSGSTAVGVTAIRAGRASSRR